MLQERPVCTEIDCDNKSFTRGLCQRCYTRKRVSRPVCVCGSIIVAIGQDACYKCRAKRSRKPVVPKTKCCNGHDYTLENTVITSNGWRRCRICIRDTGRRSDRRIMLARKELGLANVSRPSRTPSAHSSYRNYRYDRLRNFRRRCERRNTLCHLCDLPIDYCAKALQPLAFELDHHHPVATHPHLAVRSWNFRAAHSRCNRSRGSMTVEAARSLVMRNWVA